MKLTNQQRKDFIAGYDEMAHEFALLLSLQKGAILQIMKTHNFKHKFDFNDFGKEAVLYHVNRLYKQNKTELDLINEVKDLLNPPIP